MGQDYAARKAAKKNRKRSNARGVDAHGPRKSKKRRPGVVDFEEPSAAADGDGSTVDAKRKRKKSGAVSARISK
jgi:hypothetical protein